MISLDDQVRLLRARPFVDRAADGHDCVGLDLLLVTDEQVGPDDAADDALGVFQVEHGVAAGAARLGVLRVRELDGREHAAEHHVGAVLQLGRLDAWCASSRPPGSPGARPADGWKGRIRALPFPWPVSRARSHSGRSGKLAELASGWASSPPKSERCPLRRSVAAATAACTARSSPAASCARRAPSESKAPALISDSTAARLTVPGSSRSQKSARLR